MLGGLKFGKKKQPTTNDEESSSKRSKAAPPPPILGKYDSNPSAVKEKLPVGLYYPKGHPKYSEDQAKTAVADAVKVKEDETRRMKELVAKSRVDQLAVSAAATVPMTATPSSTSSMADLRKSLQNKQTPSFFISSSSSKTLSSSSSNPPTSSTSTSTSSSTSTSQPAKNNLDALAALRASFTSDKFKPQDRAQPQQQQQIQASSSSSSSSSSTSSKPQIFLAPKPTLTTADIRSNPNKSGNLSKTSSNREYTTLHGDGSNKTLADLISEESNTTQKSSDEVYARNITKMGSNYRGGEFESKKGEGGSGFDEDDQIDMTLFVDKSEKVSALANWERDKQTAIRDSIHSAKISSRSWWWLESTSFDNSLLISLGNHVSLSLVPSHLQLVKNQMLLCPISHSLSFVECEQTTWDEINYFKSSLRKLWKNNNKSVIFMETCLQSSNGGAQCKIECIPLKKSKALDASMYFQSAMTESLDEFKAVHSKIIKIGQKHQRKSMQFAVPKGFDYFNVEFDVDEGFAMIVDEAGVFEKDFGVDVVASMIGMETKRFGRKENGRKDEKEDMKQVKNVGEEWGMEGVDWTKGLK